MAFRLTFQLSRFASLGLFILGYLLATVATIQFLVQSGSDVRVPSLVGLSKMEAEKVLFDSNLRLSIQGELFSDQVSVGKILQQSIAPNEDVREGRSVGVTLSKGARARSVPRLIGLDARAVTVVSDSSRLVPRRTVTSCSEMVPSGLVIAQNPMPGELVTSHHVDLLVSRGKCLNRYLMGDFVGASYGSTAHLLQQRGFSVNFVKEEAEDLPEGTILSQNPPEKWLVSLADPIRFQVSSRMAPIGAQASLRESHLVSFQVSSPPSFFRKIANIRLEREEPLGSATIDFLLAPGKTSSFVLWLTKGSEVIVTVNGKEKIRKRYPWQ